MVHCCTFLSSIKRGTRTNLSNYTDEFRLECADYGITSGKSAASVARELGVNSKTLQRWVSIRCDELNGKRPSKADVRELREEKRIRQLEMENEFLKKAAAFFVKEQE